MAGLQPRAYTAMKPSPFKGVVWPHVTACQLADAALVVPLPSLAAWSNRVANSPRGEVHDIPQSSVGGCTASSRAILAACYTRRPA